MLLTELSPPPASGADRSDRRLLEHVSEHPASIRCRRLFEIETRRLLQVLR